MVDLFKKKKMLKNASVIQQTDDDDDGNVFLGRRVADHADDVFRKRTSMLFIIIDYRGAQSAIPLMNPVEEKKNKRKEMQRFPGL